jgi:hypothetical protein
MTGPHMSEEGFFRRWSRLKAEAPAELPAVAAPVEAPPPVAPPAKAPPVAPPAQELARKLPGLEDVERLAPDSDFSAFVTKGVDKTVQRLAMKKLFSDPHFNLVDGLDVYMGDYNQPDPVPAAMLAALHHAKSLFAQAIQDEPVPEQPAGNSQQPSQGDA